jgi:hypothetical protein
MTPDDDSRPFPPNPDPDLTTAELAQKVARTIATAFIVAGGFIALAIYSQPAPQRYQAFATDDGRIVRIDTKTGGMIGCEKGTCFTIRRRGQDLVANPDKAALPKKAPETLPAKR